jgi:hypothetical protein
MLFAYLKALASRLAGRGRGPSFPPLEDPFAGVREPRRRGPRGPTAAVALEEPDGRAVIEVDGASANRHLH